jgi:hypothetical protein
LLLLLLWIFSGGFPALVRLLRRRPSVLGGDVSKKRAAPCKKKAAAMHEFWKKFTIE